MCLCRATRDSSDQVKKEEHQLRTLIELEEKQRQLQQKALEQILSLKVTFNFFTN